MADAWGGSWGVAWGVSWGSGGTVVVTPEPTPTRKGGGRAYPGGWIPDKLWTPPRKKLKKRALKQLKELYEEAREEIPPALQVGLVPPDVLIGERAARTLPPPAEVDFDALSRSIETIKVLIAAVEDQRKAEEAKVIRRRREEEALIAMLMEIL